MTFHMSFKELLYATQTELGYCIVDRLRRITSKDDNGFDTVHFPGPDVNDAKSIQVSPPQPQIKEEQPKRCSPFKDLMQG